jgi:hypothetical protein
MANYVDQTNSKIRCNYRLRILQLTSCRNYSIKTFGGVSLFANFWYADGDSDPATLEKILLQELGMNNTNTFF